MPLGIRLVTAKDGALNGRAVKGNGITLGCQCRCGDTELHFVKPEVLVFSVGLLCTKTNGNRLTTILSGRNHNTVFVNGSPGKVGCHHGTDIVNTKGQCAGLEFLDDFGSTIVCVQGCLGKFHRQVCGHRFGQLGRSAVGLNALVILRDFSVEQFIKTNRSHDLFLHFVVIGGIHIVVVVAGFSFVSDVLSPSNGDVAGEQFSDNAIFECRVITLGVNGETHLLHIYTGVIIGIKVKGIDKRYCDHIFIWCFIRKNTRFYGYPQGFHCRMNICQKAHSLPTSSSKARFIASSQADLLARFAGFRKGFAG
nr:MAG TPA: hypothetical protein [Caudoviricetes sp.]